LLSVITDDPEGLAMIIDCCPRSLQAFFRPLHRQLSRPQYRHLWAITLAFAVNFRRSKLIHLAAAVREGRHRTSLGGFLADSDWDPEAVLSDRTWWRLKRMRPKPGEVLELLIDDTRIAKRGKKMACLCKIYDYKHHTYARGHIVVVASIRFRGVVMPWRIELWKHKKDAGKAYRKWTQIAADMIRAMPVPKGLKVRVLFDGLYLCPLVTHACKDRGFTWFSTAQRNRKFKRAGGSKKEIGQLAPGWIRHLGRNVRMQRARRWVRMRIAKVDGQLSELGRVRMVVSKRVGDPFRNMVAFATNETGLDPRKVVSIYENRWSIEILFKELRNDLGLGEYQVLDEHAIVRHLHLCALAHLMLTHHAMEGAGAQARKAHTEVLLPPMSRRLEDLRLEIRRDQLRRLFRGTKNRRLRMKIEPYLMAA
jgi:SRSO17 transposase